MLSQSGGDGGSGAASGSVAIQHEDDVPETFQQQPLLRVVQRRAHQRHDRPDAGLVQFQAIEETFHHNDRLPPQCDGAMEVKQDFRFGNPEGKR